ncbi:MAG: LysM peptidoglycan-binding domain-containing protein [Actinomycetota bacterium]|nr:LysM peptidoglycan-binding domain-containing protein [Actinomycetota bacterium]
MRPSRLIRPLTLAAAIACAAPATAGAAVAHVVGPGETLWSIAAANNLTTRTVAVYNGLPENANVVLGSTITVPTTAEGAAKLQEAGLLAAPAPTGATAGTAGTAGTAPKPMGGYTVRPGDTLSGLAAGSGVSVAQMAAMNGLSPDARIVAGTVLKLPTGAPAPARASQPAPATKVVPAAAPVPTATRVGAHDIQHIAQAAGVSPSLAAAIGWQESGFNNNMVSSANARGVMQVMPGTWDWVERNLAGRRLDPNSAADNVNAGVLYLKHLLNETGGDENTAIAGYYQGLGAVRSRGLFEDTKRYVANVQALRGRFGGG